MMMVDKVTVLDGGMGRELLRMGAPFRQPEWSALALMEAPDTVGRAHRAFIEAGAEVVTTNSYAVVPFHIGHGLFQSRGRDLADLSGRLAREAARTAAVRVAGSLPPPCGSYRPDLFESAHALEVLRTLVAGLGPHVDVWLAETQSAVREVEAVRQALGPDERPLWLSFTLADDLVDGRAVLRSGETVRLAAGAAVRLKASAMLFNCSPPEVMEAAISEACAALPRDLTVGVYANAFVPRAEVAANATLSGLRDDAGPRAYLRHAGRWVAAGASIVGGCCGIGPDHIRVLSKGLASRP